MGIKDISQQIEVVFEVEKIIHRNEQNGYTVVKAKFKSYPDKYSPPTREIIIVFNYLGGVTVEDEFKGIGQWKYTMAYGHQLVLEDIELSMPVSVKGIEEYLKKRLKGVQKKTIEKIVSVYQEETIEKIVEGAHTLVKVGVRKETARKIHEKIKEDYMVEAIFPFLRSHGVPNKQMIIIYEAFGDNTKRKIIDNPYSICALNKVSFKTADRIANSIGVKFNNLQRVIYGIKYFIDVKMKNQGDLYVLEDTIVKELMDFLKYYGCFDDDKVTTIPKKIIETAIAELEAMKKIVVTKDEQDRKCVYLSYYHKIENEIVRLLQRIILTPRAKICTNEQIEDFIHKYEAEYNFSFAVRQKEAIYMALESGISILTGGPGTGKTQTINSIIQCIKSIVPWATIELCAPTGRASRRMTELSNISAKTIHRLIGLNGFEEESELVDISADFLIVDESSMIDAYVFYKLLLAVSNNTRIIFVGDYDQLPSVGPGLILRDLINSNRIAVTRLTEIFRQAESSQIVMNSHKIIKGITSIDTNGLTFDVSKGDFYFIEKTEAIKIRETLLKSVNNLIVNKGLTVDEVQVLTVMNNGDLGVDAINKEMQIQFNPPAVDKPEVKTSPTTLLRLGDKVTQTVNNYDLQVFNGDVGRIIKIEIIQDEVEITVDFMNRTVVYNREYSTELSLAYAITVHKSQGSEFPAIVMPFHSSLNILLNRNTVYTGLTRAKKIAVCVGTIKELDEAIGKTENTVRNSQIKFKLQLAIPEIAVS